ncbi:hypothetical protein CI238_02757 [Colletotrichum incanum]|uniref:Uncharacterized protein n=1 Tax=Colletotrichum incanum TaxID=1573173 RepID=A0A167CHB5_COLIC|nr:hypothetical protein CI238_02757 [Colletotrichum incanum]
MSRLRRRPSCLMKRVRRTHKKKIVPSRLAGGQSVEPVSVAMAVEKAHNNKDTILRWVSQLTKSHAGGRALTRKPTSQEKKQETAILLCTRLCSIGCFPAATHISRLWKQILSRGSRYIGYHSSSGFTCPEFVIRCLSHNPLVLAARVFAQTSVVYKSKHEQQTRTTMEHSLAALLPL